MINVFELLLLFSKIFFTRSVLRERHRHQVVIYKFLAVFYTEILLDENKSWFVTFFYEEVNKGQNMWILTFHHQSFYTSYRKYSLEKMHINVQCIITYSFAIKIKIRQSMQARTLNTTIVCIFILKKIIIYSTQHSIPTSKLRDFFRFFLLLKLSLISWAKCIYLVLHIFLFSPGSNNLSCSISSELKMFLCSAPHISCRCSRNHNFPLARFSILYCSRISKQLCISFQFTKNHARMTPHCFC